MIAVTPSILKSQSMRGRYKVIGMWTYPQCSHGHGSPSPSNFADDCLLGTPDKAVPYERSPAKLEHRVIHDKT